MNFWSNLLFQLILVENFEFLSKFHTDAIQSLLRSLQRLGQTLQLDFAQKCILHTSLRHVDQIWNNVPNKPMLLHTTDFQLDPGCNLHFLDILLSSKFVQFWTLGIPNGYFVSKNLFLLQTNDSLIFNIWMLQTWVA